MTTFFHALEKDWNCPKVFPGHVFSTQLKFYGYSLFAHVAGGVWVVKHQPFILYFQLHAMENVKCDSCDKVFPHQAILDKHKVCHSKPWICSEPDCGKRFSRLVHLWFKSMSILKLVTLYTPLVFSGFFRTRS